MALTRKERVLQIVKQNTIRIIRENKLDDSGIDATSIAEILKLDRANVSKELNILWHEGKLIKIQGRPILFLDHNELTNAYPDSFIPLTIPCNESLTNYIRKVSHSEAFSYGELPSVNTENFDAASVIGAQGSLISQISIAKAAVSYPPHGLHMLLVGNPGVGKTEFVNYIFDYAVRHSFKPNNAKLITVNCQNFTDSRQLLAQQLFGLSKSVSRENRATKGLIEQSNGGIIYLDGIHHLNLQTINILLTAIEKGTYSRIGDITLRPLNATFIASFPQDQAFKMTHLLQNHMPIIINIPDVDETSTYEKIQVILETFSREARNLKRNIRIRKDILLYFTLMKYPENRNQIANVIRVACANALMHSASGNTDLLNIGYQHLSEKMLSNTENNSAAKQRAIEIFSIIPNDYIIFNSNGSTPAVNYIKDPPRTYSKVFSDSFMNIYQPEINKIDDFEYYAEKLMLFLMNCETIQLDNIKKMVSPHLLQTVMQLLIQSPRYERLYKKKRILLGLVLHLDEIIKEKKASGTSAGASEANGKVKSLKSTADIFLTSLEDSYSIRFTEKEAAFVSTYLSVSEKIIDKARVAILIICHGQSTATDLLKTFNELISIDVNIRALNYSHDTDMNSLLKSAAAIAREINNGAGVAVLVDMEPLLSVSDYIIQKTGIEARTLSPVTLKGIISISQLCLEGVSLHQLTLSSSYETIPNEEKGLNQQNDFINRFVSEVLMNSLTFLNPKKAVNSLIACLNNILTEENIPYSNEIAVKFLSHTVHMLERTIRNDTLAHPKLKQFINENYRLMSVIEKHLTVVGNTFGIRIPSDEVAYVTEIFNEYIG